MKLGMRSVLPILTSLSIYWLLASGALWWFYDIGPLIRGGYFSHGEAISRVMEMGLLVTILTCLAWVWSIRAARQGKLLRAWWSAAWRTLLILSMYLLAVLLRRYTWAQGQSVNDDSMFLPFVGHINAVFFSEFRWLSFLIQVIPSMTFLSGALFCIQQAWPPPKPDLNEDGKSLPKAKGAGIEADY
jgi:hypothetical protein